MTPKTPQQDLIPYRAFEHILKDYYRETVARCVLLSFAQANRPSQNELRDAVRETTGIEIPQAPAEIKELAQSAALKTIAAASAALAGGGAASAAGAASGGWGWAPARI